LKLLGECQWHRGILVQDDSAAVVVLDERRSELADSGRRQSLGLGRLQHRRNKRQLASIGLAHCFHHAKIFDERRRREIDVYSLRVLSPRARRIDHVAVETVHSRVCTRGDRSRVHHGEGRVDGVVVRKHDAGPREREIVRRDVRS
jgi:hypothetical protein